MTRTDLPLRHRAVLLTALLIALPLTAQATEHPVTLELRPHCEEQELEQQFGGPLPDIPQTVTPGEGRCPSFPVKDPLTRETSPLKQGDTLDLDLVLENPGGQPIRRFRSWLSYDPQVLEGLSVTIGRALIPTPGETDFDAVQGYVKIGASTDGELPTTAARIAIARVQLRVKQIPEGGRTAIAFHDLQEGPSGHTAVIRMEGTEERNILAPVLGSLLITFEVPVVTEALPPSSAPSIPSSLPSLPPPSALQPSALLPPSTRTAFALLQVQNLRVTTEGSTVYLAWEPLRSSELNGYNVYYGTEVGRYLHRRGVPRESMGTAIRALPLDTTYYFAVRGVNLTNEESAFSKEVAVTVGNPRTSSSPLVGQIRGEGLPPPTHPLARGTRAPTAPLPGETGIPSTIVLFLTLSAVIGTSFALRRQLIANPISHP